MLAYLNFQNQTATKSKTKEIQRTYMLLFVHTLVDVAVYQLYRAVWKKQKLVVVAFGILFWRPLDILIALLLVILMVYLEMEQLKTGISLERMGLYLGTALSDIVHNQWFTQELINLQRLG